MNMYLRSLKSERRKSLGVSKTIKLHEIDKNNEEDYYISVCGKVSMFGHNSEIIMTEMIEGAEICKNCSSKLGRLSKKKKKGNGK